MCVYSCTHNICALCSVQPTSYRISRQYHVKVTSITTSLRTNSRSQPLIANGYLLNVTTTRDDLQTRGCEWEFVSLRDSYVVGVWERKVGIVKRVLTASILLLKTRFISGDEYSSILPQEAVLIVNHSSK